MYGQVVGNDLYNDIIVLGHLPLFNPYGTIKA